MTRRTPLLAATAFLALAGCNRSADEQAAAPEPVLTTNAVPTADAAGQPLTPGSWRIEETAAGASAAFIGADNAPLLRVTCRRDDRAVMLVRSGAGSDATMFRVEAGGLTANVEMMPSPANPAELEAVVDPTEPIFAAFADPAASIVVSAPGAPTLRLPTHTGSSRVIQACS